MLSLSLALLCSSGWIGVDVMKTKPIRNPMVLSQTRDGLSKVNRLLCGRNLVSTFMTHTCGTYGNTSLPSSVIVLRDRVALSLQLQ
jgi:hypothetical protein